MAHRKVKVAILRARHDIAYEQISDWRCLQMFNHNEAGQAVLEFWKDVSGGYFDFSVGLMPWIDVDFSTLPVDPNSRSILRWDQMDMAYGATSPLVEGLDTYDAYILLTYPGTSVALASPVPGAAGQPPITTPNLDGGAWPSADGKGRATLGVVNTNHATYCHEVGHALGFEHSYGLPTPTYPTGVYGDAYDIMSGAVSRFQGYAIPGWPEPTLALPALMSCGPAVSLAHLHFFEPSSMDSAVVRHITAPPAGGSTSPARLNAARGHGTGIQLLVVHPVGEDAEGRGRMYVEYRRASGWDAGLSAHAVVVHEIADSPDGVRCWYRSRILLPLGPDTDVTLGTKPWSVRITETGDDKPGAPAYVVVAVGVSQGPGVEIVSTPSVRDVTGVGLVTSTTPCGDEVSRGTWITVSEGVFTARTFGYGQANDPESATVLISWSVAGAALMGGVGGWSDIEVPNATGTTRLRYRIYPTAGTLQLKSDPGEVCSVFVSAVATSADGSRPTSATAPFEARGSRTGWGAGDLRQITTCLTDRLLAKRFSLADLVIPTSPVPDPAWHQRIARINIGRITELARTIAATDHTAAEDLTRLARMRYGADSESVLPPTSPRPNPTNQRPR